MIARNDESCLQSTSYLVQKTSHEETQWLSRLTIEIALNARMRRIDLFCKLAGPLFIALINGASTKVAIFVLLGTNAVSVPIEYLAIAQVFIHKSSDENNPTANQQRYTSQFPFSRAQKTYNPPPPKPQLLAKVHQNRYHLFPNGSPPSPKSSSSTTNIQPSSHLSPFPSSTSQS